MRLARTGGLLIFAASGVIAACGHLPMDLLPLDEPELTAEAGVPPLDASGLDGARGDGDIDPPRDGGDPPDEDGGPIKDAGCGRDCTGLFVSEALGDDKNAGTSVAPFRTLKRAFEGIKGGRTVDTIYVSGGKYTDKVTLVEGVSMEGAYVCPKDKAPCDWSVRDFNLKSEILNLDAEGVLAPKNITRKTVFKGFRVRGGGSVLATTVFGSVGITLVGAPSLVTNEVFAGDVSSGPAQRRRSIGIVVTGGGDVPEGPAIDDCFVQGGDAAEQSIGLLMDRVVTTSLLTANATVTRSIITGGKALASTAVYASNSGTATVLDDNTLSGGTSSGDGTGTSVGASWAIVVSSAMTITRNRINVPPTDANPPVQCALGMLVFCGGIHSTGSRMIIANNYIGGARGSKSAAIVLTDGEDTTRRVVINSNVLSGAGIKGQPLSTALVVKSSHGNKVTIGEVKNNILLGGFADARHAIYEEAPEGGEAHLVALDYNDFFFNSGGFQPGDVAYRGWDPVQNAPRPLTYAELPTELSTPPPNNIFKLDPELIGSPPMRLSPSSPLINLGPEPANDQDAPKIDFENDKRTNKLDIGADEVK